MALEVEDLACRRGGRVVFQGLTFRVDEGRVLAVRGPNGVGKSTLLRALAGFLSPSAGSISLGAASSRDRPAWQEHVAYAGHQDAVKGALTVRQNLNVWAALFGTPESYVDHALAAFGLDQIADRMAAECSAGQRRRLGLARLIVVGRALWLLDEPTVSLDDQACAQFVSMVQDHTAKGGIAVIATHIELGLAAIDTMHMDMPSEPLLAEDAFLDGNWG